MKIHLKKINNKKYYCKYALPNGEAIEAKYDNEKERGYIKIPDKNWIKLNKENPNNFANIKIFDIAKLDNEIIFNISFFGFETPKQKMIYTFANGITVCNFSKTPLRFLDNVTGEVILLQSENCIPMKIEKVFSEYGEYYNHLPLEEGYKIICEVMQKYGRETVILGSPAAAFVYRNLVFEPVRLVGHSNAPTKKMLHYSNLFRLYTKEKIMYRVDNNYIEMDDTAYYPHSIHYNTKIGVSK